MDILDDDFHEIELPAELLPRSKKVAMWANISAIISLANALLQVIMTLKYGFNQIQDLVGSLISIGIAIVLLGYAKSLNKFSITGSSIDFSNVMQRNKLYWLFLGILMIVVIILLLFAVIFFIINTNGRF